jgi:hygromycin-B 7''-O-kinase
VASQRAQCLSRQRKLGLPALWADQIPGFLDALALSSGPPVLLHTELMREHLLVTPDPWRLSGLVDFEPAMPGAREYEFAAVGAFLSEGDGRFLRRMLLAYGYDQSQLDAALRRRFLAWLLHRYSDLPWYFSRLPGPASPTLGALADRWFATD